MDDEEIEVWIGVLRGMLDENGFSWARQQAEAALHPGWHRRWLARALLDAAENITVDLAQVELAVSSGLGTDDFGFKPDDGADPDGDAFVPEQRSEFTERIDMLRGPERRETLHRLAGMRDEFEMLRALLNGAA